MPSHTDSDPRSSGSESPSTPALVTPALLRQWPLPSAGESKYGRGQVLVVGGARGTPGAVVLAGLAALRVGAGRLSLAVAESVAAHVAVSVPEAGVIGLPENSDGSVLGDVPRSLQQAISRADVVLIGSGLDDPQQSSELLRACIPLLPPDIPLVLDAFALGVLPEVREADRCRGRMVLTPNEEEADRLLGENRQENGHPDDDWATARIAAHYGAAVSCRGHISDQGEHSWLISSGHSGLGTSGSGDVLAGAIAGLLARGASPAQATCWGTHLHAAAGDRLAARIGALGFLARELLDELPLVMTELQA